MRKILVVFIMIVMTTGVFGATYHCRPQSESARDAATLDWSNGKYLICGHHGTDGCDNGTVIFSDIEKYFYKCDSSGRNKWERLYHPDFPECNTDTVITRNLPIITDVYKEYAVDKSENTEALSSICKLNYEDRCEKSGGDHIGGGHGCLCSSEYGLRSKNYFECECEKNGYKLDRRGKHWRNNLCVPHELLERGDRCKILADGSKLKLYLCPFELEYDTVEYSVVSANEQIWPLPSQGDCYFLDNWITLNDKIFCNDGGRIVEKPYACSGFSPEQIRAVPEEQREPRTENGFFCWAIAGQKSVGEKSSKQIRETEKQNKIEEPIEEVVDNKTGTKKTVKYNYQQCQKDTDCTGIDNTKRPYLHSTAWHCWQQNSGVKVCTATACDDGYEPKNGYCQAKTTTMTTTVPNEKPSGTVTETIPGVITPVKKTCSDPNMDANCECSRVADTVERGGKCVCNDSNKEIKNGKCEWTAAYIAGLESNINDTYDLLRSTMSGFKTSVWRDADGSFNTARLASDSIAGVVLGTVGGIVTANVVKKAQVKQGFEDMKCAIGGRSVANFGDEFTVGN